MSIKDLYEWAIENEVEDYEVQIQYRDDGGYYCGHDYLDECNIEIDHRGQIVTL